MRKGRFIYLGYLFQNHFAGNLFITNGDGPIYFVSDWFQLRLCLVLRIMRFRFSQLQLIVFSCHSQVGLFLCEFSV